VLLVVAVPLPLALPLPCDAPLLGVTGVTGVTRVTGVTGVTGATRVTGRATLPVPPPVLVGLLSATPLPVDLIGVAGTCVLATSDGLRVAA
jgi:hypothetical protein